MTNIFNSYIIILLLFSCMLLSCAKSDVINTVPGGDNQSNLLNGKINVKVSICQNLLEGIVHLYVFAEMHFTHAYGFDLIDE